MVLYRETSIMAPQRTQMCPDEIRYKAPSSDPRENIEDAVYSALDYPNK